MSLLLDTNVCIPLINRTEQGLAERVLDATPSSVLLCSVVEAELYFGARNSRRVAENLHRVERFFLSSIHSHSTMRLRRTMALSERNSSVKGVRSEQTI